MSFHTTGRLQLAYGRGLPNKYLVESASLHSVLNAKYFDAIKKENAALLNNAKEEFAFHDILFREYGDACNYVKDERFSKAEESLYKLKMYLSGCEYDKLQVSLHLAACDVAMKQIRRIRRLLPESIRAEAFEPVRA